MNERAIDETELLDMAQNELKQFQSDLKNQPTQLEEPDSSLMPLTDEELRRNILKTTLDRANSIYIDISNKEQSKNKWRTFFIVLCCSLLVISLILVFVLIFLSGQRMLYVEKEIIIALLTYIVANFFTILIFMIKYVHSSQYLETFRTVTYKLLDYVLADKNGRQESSKSSESSIWSDKEP